MKCCVRYQHCYVIVDQIRLIVVNKIIKSLYFFKKQKQNVSKLSIRKNSPEKVINWRKKYIYYNYDYISFLFNWLVVMYSKTYIYIYIIVKKSFYCSIYLHKYIFFILPLIIILSN